jgi:subtilisin family serine protease
VVATAAPAVTPPAATPDETCGGTRQAGAWRNHANLKRRGVTDIGAPLLWDAGIRGRGVRLAILDTGVDKTHVDLDDDDFERWGAGGCAPKVIADALFLGGQTFRGQGAMDVGSHGTHVAGEAAGTAEGSADGTKAAYPGVAPEASLLAGRICLDVTALTDDMLAAAEWAVIEQKADVVNMSFGIDPRAGVLNDANDPQSAGFEALATNPAWGWPTITISAGNSGDLFNSVGIPAAAPHVNAVAASVKDFDLALRAGEKTEAGTPAIGAKDTSGRVHPSIAGFSSRGPSADYAFTPDFAAPGRRIVAPLTNQNTDQVTNGYASFSGTSMAAPHAAGGATLLVDGYRQRFGTSGAFGGRPPSWLVAAALANTAGIPTSRPSYAGGRLAKVSYATGTDGLLLMYAENNARENRLKPLPPVGPLVEGAGRINLPEALKALTGGVVIYTDGSKTAPAPYELQPHFAGGTAKPGGDVARRLVIHPATNAAFSVSFRAAAGTASINAKTIAPSWWTLPPDVSTSGGRDAAADVKLSIPAGIPAGTYTGYLLADVTGPGVATTLRLPAMVVVEVVDYSADAGSTGAADGATSLYGAQQTYTGALNFVAGSAGLPVPDGVVQDMPTFAVEVPEGLQSLEIAVDGAGSFAGTAGSWDLFLYDATGVDVADTWASSSASLSVPGLAPGRYRIAVVLAEPSATAAAFEDPRGVPFRLTVDLVGAATKRPTQVGGVRQPPKRRTGGLPATGVPATGAWLGLLLLATAAGVKRAIRDQR